MKFYFQLKSQYLVKTYALETLNPNNFNNKMSPSSKLTLLTKELQGRPVYQLQYGSNAKPLKWNGVDRYLADRTTLIDCFFLDVKQGRVQFLAEPEMKEAFEDFLALYEETMPSGKKVWRHSPNAPDDCLHAAVFSWAACKILTHDLKFYSS